MADFDAMLADTTWYVVQMTLSKTDHYLCQSGMRLQHGVQETGDGNERTYRKSLS